MSGVIVVDAESFRSTCLGRDAYIHDHYLDMLITMLNSVNCSTVICSPTVEYLCSWEKPLVKPMAPRVYSHHINLHHFIIALLYTFPFTFTLHLYIKNTKNIILSYLSNLTLVSDRWGIDNPFIALVARLLFVCVGAKDSCVISYWIDTLVLKNWGKYLRYFTGSPFPLQGKTNAVLKR